jgi:alpha-1,3-rhamnosyltransferase
MFFSVIITTYNAENFLVDALNSLKNQTFQGFDIIIADDFSTDNTLEICKKWFIENPEFQSRLKIIESNKNTGVSANTNRGLKIASGEWIQVLSADDALTENALETAQKFILENNLECSIVQGIAAVYIYDFSSENFVKFISQNQKKSEFFEHSAEQQYQQLLRYDRVVAPAVFYKKSIVEQVGFCDETIPMIDDWPLWLKLTKIGYKFYFLNEIVVNYRIHERSITNENQGLFVSNLHRKNRAVYKTYILPNLPFFARLAYHFNYAFKEFLFRFCNSEKNYFAKSVLCILRFFKRKIFRIKNEFAQNPKHIAVFLQNFEINGYCIVCANYVDLLIKNNYSVDLIVANERGNGKSIFSKQAKIVNLGNIRVRKSIWKLRQYLKKNSVSTLICIGNLPNFASVLSTFGLRKKINLILSQHGFTSDLDDKNTGLIGRLTPFLKRKLYPLADHIIAVSTAVSDDLKKLIPRLRSGTQKYEKISTIYNFVNIQHIRNLSERPILQELPKNYIAFVGRLARVKNIDLLINAIALIHDSDLHLVIVGEGSEYNTLNDLVQKLNLSNRVHFLDPMPNVLPILKNAKIVAIPSFTETLSMVAIESAILEKTIVCTPNTGCLDVLGHNGGYFSETFDNPKEFANLLKKALEKPIDSAILSEKAKRFDESNAWHLLEKILKKA